MGQHADWFNSGYQIDSLAETIPEHRVISRQNTFRPLNDAGFAGALMKAAQFNDAVGWIRLPIFVVVSSFIFAFLGAETGFLWLAAAILTDRISVYFRRRTARGEQRFALPYLLSLYAISLCWVSHAFLIWFVGGEFEHLIGIIDLFMVMIYGITGGQHSCSILGALVFVPLAAFFGLMSYNMWTSLDVVSAVCGSMATFGACVAVVATSLSSHRAAQSLQQANHNLAAAMVELDTRRLEAENASKAKNEFLALMSHEIRTPMNSVIGLLEVLLRSELAPKQIEHAAIAQSAANDLLYLLDDVIDISRLEARGMTVETLPFQPASIADHAESTFRARAEAGKLKLHMSIDPGTPDWVSGDPRRIRQVLGNLVGNAIKYTETGTIAVHVSWRDGELRFDVHDTGIGLSEDALGKIFMPFYQADASSTRSYGGAGLGLSICKQLVDLMDGAIGVESLPGSGSHFWFSLPAPISAPPVAMTPDEQTDIRQMRILIAEDNMAMQRILTTLLLEFGHQVVVVSNGAEAVAAIASEEFDVLIMDVMMPVMDGPTAAGKIRAMGGRAGSIPILGLTANALVGDRERYIAAGMTDCLSKPIDVAAVLAALRKAQSPASSS